MVRVRTFRDLVAWKKSMEVVRMVYLATENMPTSEQFGLTPQMRRAAVSVPSNIAEGYGRQSRRDYLKHLRIARASLAELLTQFELAVTLRLLPINIELSEQLEETERVLQALITSLERKERMASRWTKNPQWRRE